MGAGRWCVYAALGVLNLHVQFAVLAPAARELGGAGFATVPGGALVLGAGFGALLCPWFRRSLGTRRLNVGVALLGVGGSLLQFQGARSSPFWLVVGTLGHSATLASTLLWLPVLGTKESDWAHLRPSHFPVVSASTPPSTVLACAGALLAYATRRALDDDDDPRSGSFVACACVGLAQAVVGLGTRSPFPHMHQERDSASASKGGSGRSAVQPQQPRAQARGRPVARWLHAPRVWHSWLVLAIASCLCLAMLCVLPLRLDREGRSPLTTTSVVTLVPTAALVTTPVTSRLLSVTPSWAVVVLGLVGLGEALYVMFICDSLAHKLVAATLLGVGWNLASLPAARSLFAEQDEHDAPAIWFFALAFVSVPTGLFVACAGTVMDALGWRTLLAVGIGIAGCGVGASVAWAWALVRAARPADDQSAGHGRRGPIPFLLGARADPMPFDLPPLGVPQATRPPLPEPV